MWQAVLTAAFDLRVKVVGISDPVEDVHYPMSLLSRAPNFVSCPVFGKITRGGNMLMAGTFMTPSCADRAL